MSANTPGPSARKLAKAAAEHHATLNTFAAVVTLLEGGMVYDPAAYRTTARIIKLCLAEQQRQLRKYDAAITRATGAQP